jgi:hypothetical protein
VDLEFWPDGMLEELTLVAKGQGTKASFKRLEKELESTTMEVEKIIQGLERSRRDISKLKDGEIVVKQVNHILFDEQVGKSTIRRHIKRLIGTHKRTKAVKNLYMRNESLSICNAIDAFNASLHRLKRIVYGL